MKLLGLSLALALAACGTAATNMAISGSHGSDGGANGGSDAGQAGSGGSDAGQPSEDAGAAGSSNGDAGGGAKASDAALGTDAAAEACPAGYTAGTANGLPVCSAPSGIPLFTHVFLILMENTSLSTLQPAFVDGGAAPNLAAMARTYATATDYHGVAHPSLPNYVALTSGATQGIACDCEAVRDAGTCGLLCNSTLNDGTCSCDVSVQNLADQIEAAGETWMAFGEDMGATTPCNLVNSGNYAVRHVPFLYYDDVQTNAARCNAHVVDFSFFEVASAPTFTFIAPNLIDDMHNPDPTTSANIPDGDMWIGPQVASIVASAAYKSGGLLVVVWDEDDLSGAGPLDTNDPIPIFVMSPYAKSGGYVSTVDANHYSLLATIEDGLGLPRLGSATTATPLKDYFPAN